MKILMVCLGNICRSPMAEGIMRNKLPDGFEVDSAGTIALHTGSRPDQRAVEVSRHHGVDISKLKARQMKKSDLDTFDIIYCMDLHNYEDVISLAETKEQRDKISLLLEAAGNHTNAEVPDPYYGEIEAFEKVFNMLNKACDVIAKELIKKES